MHSSITTITSLILFASGFAAASPPGRVLPHHKGGPADVYTGALDKPFPIPSGHKSCFDRNNHVFSYSYDHGDRGYHFATTVTGCKASPTGTEPCLTTSILSFSSTTSKGYASTSNSYNSTVTWGTPRVSSSTTKLPVMSSFYQNSNTTTATASTTPALNSTAPNAPCQPELQLEGVLENGFNPKNAPFSVKIANCSKFDTSNTTAFVNFAPIDGISVNADSISFPGLSTDYVLLSIFALDTYGTPVLKSFQFHFGSINMPILVLGPDGQPASGVLVTGSATIYPGLSETCTTDSLGQCQLSNLPATTIGIVATTADNSITVNDLAPTTAKVTLQLLPFVQPSTNTTFDVANGTTGWTGGSLSSSFKIKRDISLVVGTNAQYTLQSASNSFPVHPFTKTAYIKYKFITSEVPGGYFGTQYNDYYSVTIRSDTGQYVTVTNSMNALGLGAFDSSGATDWFTLTLQVPSTTKSVEYNIGVSNVADNLLDSSIVVSSVGDLQCDQCGDCASCPSDPMCQSICQDPPIKSCGFYRQCAEAQLSCGASGYALAYGEKNCNRFTNNLNWFSADGQDWIFGTMHCLQTAMVPVLKPCTATCESFEQAAFDSHPGCYVNNGFCRLQCPDILAVLMTVNTDLISLQSLKQIAQTAGGCLQNMIETLTGCTGDVVFGSAFGVLSGAGAAPAIAISVAIKYLITALEL